MDVTVIADSKNVAVRLTTLLINLPTYMVPTLLAQRELSVTRRRMTSSVKTFVEYSGASLTPTPDSGAKTPFGQTGNVARFVTARDAACRSARSMAYAPDAADIAIVDRILTPYSKTQVVVSSASWLTVVDRLSMSRSTETVKLTQEISSVLRNQSPVAKGQGEWHLPFIEPNDVDAAMSVVLQDLGVQPLLEQNAYDLTISALCKVSAARCLSAERVGRNDVERIKNDLDLFSSEIGTTPMLRPDACEHQASPDSVSDGVPQWLNHNLHGNTKGWCQFRYVYEWEAWRDRVVSNEE